LLSMNQPRTKTMLDVLKNLKIDRKALVVAAEYDDNIALSARNIPGVKFVVADGINVLDVIGYDKLIITKEAVQKIEEVLA
jgi:large subunit ribosomal protein L4